MSKSWKASLAEVLRTHNRVRSGGSVASYLTQEKRGDVLFAGGVGRWDLPGGDRDLLFGGIKSKLFPLGDDVKVLPGHGPATTIGAERTENAFVGEAGE